MFYVVTKLGQERYMNILHYYLWMGIEKYEKEH
jgi:hypothetical protein